jgi:hypothetical protein
MPLVTSGSRLIRHRASTSSNGLLTNLIGYWGMDEAGGANNALDKHSNALTLTQANSPGSAAGLVYAGARTCDGVNQSFSRASGTILQAGDIDFAIAAWVRPAVTNAYMGIFSKWGQATAAELEYSLRQWNDGTFQFAVTNTANSVGSVTSTATATQNQWCLVVAYHDATANKLGISINGGTAITADWTTGVKASIYSLYVGRSYLPDGQFYNGRIGPVQFWKNRILDATARTALYNAGAGLTYAALTA